MENNFSNSYVSLLEDLMNNGDEKSPRGQKIKYFQNYLLKVKSPGDVYSCNSRKYSWDYLNNELELYFKGVTSVEDFSKASKFWGKLANPDNTINSSYGYLVFYKQIENKFGTIKNQWEWAKSQLISDKDTRQALMFISSPHVQFEGNKDFICTLNYTFDIKDDKINLTVNRRSQDVILGITYDYPWEYLLMCKMCNELKEYYPNLEIGTYTLFCNNIHVYERNWDLVNNMINDYHKLNYKSERILDFVNKNLIDDYVMNKDF